MTRPSLREYAAVQRERYLTATRAEKGALLDEVVTVTGLHRKAAIRLLRRPSRAPTTRSRAGRPRRYGPAVAQAVEVLGQATGHIGPHRLQPFVPELLDRLTRDGELTLAPEVDKLVRHASPATLGRLLAPARATRPPRGTTTTRVGTRRRHEIPIRTFTEWDDAGPGFLEIDLVAHCGSSTKDFYLCRLCAVDVTTAWVELEAIWGKRHERGGGGVHRVRQRLPMPLRGLDSDNVLSARGWSSAGTQHSSGGSGSRDSVRQQRTPPTQRSSASEKDPAAHSEHRVRARAGLALTALNTA